MASAPKLPYPERTKPAKRLEIRLGNEDGDDPLDTEVTTRLRNPVCHFNSGGTLDHIELEYDLAGQGKRILDTYLQAGFTRQVEVAMKSTTKGGKDKLIAWGEITGETKTLKGGPGGGEWITLIASVCKYHFGNQLLGPVYRQTTSGHDSVVHQTKIVCNPVVNTLVEGNMSSHFDVETDTFRVWVHPDSVRTATAQTAVQSGDIGSEWDLPHLVNTLCYHLNPTGEFIENPSLTDLQTWLKDAPVVRDVELEAGKHLNELLDDLLSAHGYAWRLDYSYNYLISSRQIKLIIYAKNGGKEVVLMHQRPFDIAGARFDRSNVQDLKLETEIASTANQIRGHGGRKEYEITAELYRGWSEVDDALSAEQLTQSLKLNAKAFQAPWRLWVLNEAGDYCGLRTVVAPIPGTPFDLTSILGTDSIPKRRKADDCLTHFKDDTDNGARRRRPVFVEYRDVSGNWTPLPDGWGETVLEDQIGIYFGGDAPPEELIQMGNDARLRITFTVVSDIAITATANKQASSPNGRVNQLFLDVSDRFVYRQIQSTGPLASTLGGLPSSDARDDSTKLQTFVDTLRTTEDCAIMRGSAVVFGLQTQFQLGQVVREVKYRNISLNRMAKTSKEKRYLQIVGKTFDYKSQTTTLTMEPIQEEVNKKFAGWVA